MARKRQPATPAIFLAEAERPRMVVTITREEVNPRQMPAYRWTWKYVYKIANVPKPHSRLNLAVREARRKWPGCRLKYAWKQGAKGGAA